jgi:hypothetical protein
MVLYRVVLQLIGIRPVVAFGNDAYINLNMILITNKTITLTTM